jgi:uncharacterized protein (DUF302 family)
MHPAASAAGCCGSNQDARLRGGNVMRRHGLHLMLLAALALATLPAAAQPVVSYVKAGAKFDDIRDNVRTAIENRGLVVDYQGQIGQMLDRTGADVGSTKPLYAGAQSLQFCSAKLSRKTMEAYAGNVVMCPYSIVVYATAAKPGDVVVAYRRLMSPGGGPASRRALDEVEALLDAIAREAVGRQ